MFLGVFLYIFLLGGMVNLLQNIDLASAEFQAYRQKINTFLQLREVPSEMQMRVHTYLDHVWMLKHGVEEKDVLQSLPAFLRHDLAWFLNQHFLARIPMFYGADTSALLELNQHLVMTVANTDEYVNRVGELGHEMHFLLSGEVHILGEDGNPELQLFEGAILGEVCIFFEIPSPFDARVHSTATMFTLQDSNFETLIAQFPGLVKRIDSRGIAVYGDKWTKWAKLAEEMDRGDVDSTESRHNESIGNFEQLSYSRTFLRKATTNTKGPSNIKNGERLARSSSAAPMIQGMEPLRRTGSLKRLQSRKSLLGHGIVPSSSHDSLEELAEGKGET